MIFTCKNCKRFLLKYKEENKIKVSKCKGISFIDKGIIKIKCTCKTENIIKIN